METTLFERWKCEKRLLRAEVISGNISLTFTGVVKNYSLTELRLARDEDELSISLFCGQYTYIGAIDGTEEAKQYFAENYECVMQITTDAGASCTIYEMRN